MLNFIDSRLEERMVRLESSKQAAEEEKEAMKATLVKLESNLMSLTGNPPLQVDSFFILDTRLDERMLRLEGKVMAINAQLLAKLNLPKVEVTQSQGTPKGET